MKKILLATVLTLVMLSPAWAADVRFPPGSWLVASKQEDGRNGNAKSRQEEEKKPSTVIIKGKGGKVTGVEQDPQQRPSKKR
ncbi:hypothetical protein DND132_2979 [Pseudodesulfovibrio mercurii]|uniref:DUF2147 domain-containing protein n=1 Tax=Pseudodesulfovibrio mercurii TaxID=641491 RepID=F0JJT3_9BACT|nr:hypothetical protein [Pseudodesulfovibrio mercurii]EGB16182.1 hypothetical protein DND132_2979 [Pseudodesulfovibrio mercurii]